MIVTFNLLKTDMQGAEQHDSRRCPIARSIKRTLHLPDSEITEVRVEPDDVTFDNGYLMQCASLPDSVTDFIEEWDGYDWDEEERGPSPSDFSEFEFVLDLPPEIAARAFKP